jgi:phosphonate transport system permease protein
MSIASLSAVTDEQVAALRQSHGSVWPGLGGMLRRWWPLLAALVYLVWSMWYFDFGRLLESSERVLALLRNFLVWQDMGDWAYRQIYVGIAQTLAMAFLGTLLGTLGALVVGFLAAKNVMPLAIVRQAVRRVLDILRGIDQLVWGLVFVRAVGLGPLAGCWRSSSRTSARCPSSIPRRSRTSTASRWRACASTGAGPLGVIRYGYIPQVLAGVHLAIAVLPGIQHALGHDPRHRGSGGRRDDHHRTLPRARFTTRWPSWC